MGQRHLTAPNVEEIEAEIGKSVYVSPRAAEGDLRSVKRIWAEEIRSESDGRLKGEVRGYGGENPAYAHSDMRLTWTFVAVEPGGVVVASHRLTPYENADEADASEIGDLAREVAEGERSLSDAKRTAQRRASSRAADELESLIDAGWPGDDFWAKVKSPTVKEIQEL